MEDEAVARIQKDHAEKARKTSKSTVMANVTEVVNIKDLDFEKPPETRKPSAVSDKDPFSTPPLSPYDPDHYPLSSEDLVSPEESYRRQANEAFASVGAKAPCKPTPSQLPPIPSHPI